MKKSNQIIPQCFILVIFMFLSLPTQVKALNSSNGDHIHTVMRNGDDITTVKLKVPTVNMFKVADREMHMNMYNELKSVFNLPVNASFAMKSDIEIEKQFYSSYQLFFDNSIFFQSDDEVEQSFWIENMTTSFTNRFDESDKIMHSFFLNEH